MAPRFLTSLIPRRASRDQNARPLLTVLAGLTWLQWAHFFTGWLAWTCDAIDFFSVSLSVNALTKEFGRSTHDITTAITLTLLLRSVGAVIFGVISDRYGRKWPLIFNLILVAILELAAGFVNDYAAFLGVRSLFGIGMGGIWGLAASTALENLPVEARGLASGVLQQGYAVGYLLAACIQLKLVPQVDARGDDGWRALFWTASGISFFAAAIRVFLPESEYFLKAQAKAREAGTDTQAHAVNKTRVFMRELKAMMKQHWLLCIYAVLLMTGFNFLSHGSQDLYPTYLRDTKGFTAYNSTVATIIGNCGAIAGGVVAGSVSQYIGRRLTIIIFVCIVAAFIPLWILPNNFSALAAGAFCLQFGVQGAWGVIPIQLAELSPPAFRATFPGVAYQLGNMVSSASAQIEATGGENLRTTLRDPKTGALKNVPDYAKVQGIFIGCIAAFVIFITLVGPENHSSRFEEGKAAFEEGAVADPNVHAPGQHHTDEEKVVSSQNDSGTNSLRSEKVKE